MPKPSKKNNTCKLEYAGKESEEDILNGRGAENLVTEGYFNTKNSARDAQNLLIKGDNLPVLQTLIKMKNAGHAALTNTDGTAGARLIYIDPPFSTMLKFRAKDKQHAYDDNKTGAVFIEFLRKRLVLLRELLSPNGSIYVHLDWKKAHYVKAVMDEVFGEENFLNDIVWSYGGRGAKAIANQFSRNHDIILWYRKGLSHIFNKISGEKRFAKGVGGFKQDEDGRWFKTAPRGDYTDGSIKELEKAGRIYRTRNNTVRIKYFLREDESHVIEDRLVGDVWDDIPDAMHISRAEKTGYPTQKPEALLNRVISASSMQGDIVLDAFAGSGTTLVTAEKLGRRWIGIDSGSLAINTAKKRLENLNGKGNKPVSFMFCGAKSK